LVYARKRSTKKAVVASRPKISFWPDCSTSPEYYGWLFVCWNGPRKLPLRTLAIHNSTLYYGLT
jgi:hypothetical protein